MLEFAVAVKGLDEAYWVLAVEGERFLIAHADRSLQWHPMEDCTFVKCMSPDQPRAVIPVQPQQKLTIPAGRFAGNGR